MNTKTVYSFDPSTRSYLGPLVLDEGDRSPLEPDVWHIPGNCIEVPPPADVPAGKYAAALADLSGWEIIDVPVAVGVEATRAAAHAEAQRVLSVPEQAQMLHASVQAYLDAQARVHRFESIAEAVSYATSPVPKYYGQGRAFVVLRDHTWAIVEPIIDDILAGTIEPLKFAALAERLPVYDAIQAEVDAKLLQASIDAAAANKKAAADAEAARLTQAAGAPAVADTAAPAKRKKAR